MKKHKPRSSIGLAAIAAVAAVLGYIVHPHHRITFTPARLRRTEEESTLLLAKAEQKRQRKNHKRFLNEVLKKNTNYNGV